MTADVFAVLGMHRSGTSWLAGTLQSLGLPLGEVNESAPYNERGNRENERLMALHASVFADSGATWARPPAHVVWSQKNRAAVAEFVREMDGAHERWGFKDPRTMFLLEGWEQLAGRRITCVGIYRHPVNVAQSLLRRGASSVPVRRGLEIWSTYNTRLLELHDQRGFPLLCFDAAPADLDAAVRAVARAWGLPRADTGEAFFADDLVHNRAARPRVPWACRSVWRRLRAATFVAAPA